MTHPAEASRAIGFWSVRLWVQHAAALHKLAERDCCGQTALLAPQYGVPLTFCLSFYDIPRSIAAIRAVFGIFASLRICQRRWLGVR